MHIRVVAPLQYFNIQDVDSFQLRSFLVTNDKKVLLPILTNYEIVKYLGTVNIDTITKGYFAYFDGDHKNLIGGQEDDILSDITAKICELLNSYMNVLWFVKDNSSFVNVCYLIYYPTNQIRINTRNIFQSNIKGEYKTVTYNELDINAWIKLIESRSKQATLITSSNRPVAHIEEGEASAYTGAINYAIYNYNRVERAMLFLSKANNETNLIVKITFLIPIYESLFTSKDSKNEISHQVSERASLYIGKNVDQRIEIYKLLKFAYVIRSKFVHGDVVTKDREQLLEIVQPLGVLTRTLFLKILSDNSVFITYNNTEFDDYFKKLIFS